MANTKRTYQLDDETDLVNSYVLTDKSGNKEARRQAASIFALKTDLSAVELGSSYLDFNYAGYSSLNGRYLLKGLGSAISNAFFTPQAAVNYTMFMEVTNIATKLHIVNIFATSPDDPAVKNNHAVRMNDTFALAIISGWQEYTKSPFTYVAGIQQEQVTDDTDRINSSGAYITTGLVLALTELSPDSDLRFDVSFLTGGTNPNAQVQFRIMENAALLAEGNVIDIGNDTISNSFSFLLKNHDPTPPTTYEIEFKNIGSPVTIFGTQKSNSLIFTETHQAIR